MPNENDTPNPITGEVSRPVREKRGLLAEFSKIKLDRRPTSIARDPEYLATLPSLVEVYKNVEFWHGTGRYKYSETGEIVDILTGLLQEGGLVPHSDDWDRKRGHVKTVSLSFSRMYARLYSGRYVPNGGRIQNELGTRQLWGSYFFGTSLIAGILEYPPNLSEIRKKGVLAIGESIILDGRRKTREWRGKTTRQPVSFRDIFLNGTDIQQNYPVLIGIKRGAARPVDSSRFIRLHERRSEQPVLISDFTHLEVPKDKVEETILILRETGHDKIPVIPIEYGEEYCRKFPFHKLVGDKPLVSR